MFGPRIVRAFEAVKDRVDPDGVLNPGKIVRAPRMDDRRLLRYGPHYRESDTKTVLDWSAWPGPGRRFPGCRRDVQQQRRLPQVCRRGDVPVMAGHARRKAPGARPGQYFAAGTVRSARTRRHGLRRHGRCDGTVRVVQGLPPRVPDRRRYGAHEDRGAGGPFGPTRPVAAGPDLWPFSTHCATHGARALAIASAEPHPRPATTDRSRVGIIVAAIPARMVGPTLHRGEGRRPGRRPAGGAVCRHLQPLDRARHPPRRGSCVGRSRPPGGFSGASRQVRTSAVLRPDLSVGRSGRPRPPGDGTNRGGFRPAHR